MNSAFVFFTGPPHSPSPRTHGLPVRLPRHARHRHPFCRRWCARRRHFDRIRHRLTPPLLYLRRSPAFRRTAFSILSAWVFLLSTGHWSPSTSSSRSASRSTTRAGPEPTRTSFSAPVRISRGGWPARRWSPRRLLPTRRWPSPNWSRRAAWQATGCGGTWRWATC